MPLEKKEMEELAAAVAQVAEGEIAKQIKEGLGEVRKDIDKKFEEGLSPADDKVQDLEKKIDEYESKIDDLVKKHGDEIRLLKAEAREIGVNVLRAEGGPVDAMRVDYKGQFMTKERMKWIVDNFSGAGDGPVKRDLTTGGSGNTGLVDQGRLSTEVAERFIDLIVEETPTLSRIVTRRMVSPEARLDEMLTATRTIRKATENTDITASDVVTLSGRTLTTIEVGMAQNITLSFLEDNIERENAEAHVASALARAFGTDINDLLWNGVFSASTGFVDILDGINELLSDNIAGSGTAGIDEASETDVSGATTASAAFRLMHKTIPQRFKTRTDYNFFVPTGTAEVYADEVQQRETALGDSVLIGGFPNLRYFGRSVVPDPHLGTTLNRAYLFPVQLAVWGVHRGIRIDSEYQPRPRRVEYTITTRIGAQIVGPQTFVRSAAALPAGIR